MSAESFSSEPRRSLLTDPRARGIALQAALVLFFGLLLTAAVLNARANMQARGIPTDLSFWNNTSGFDINQSLISYSAVSSYGRAFFVGLLNTLLVAAIGLVLATIIGFAVGVARLSSNFIVAKLATVYVEALRNVPLLLQLLFWYNAVLRPLPPPRQSIGFGGVFLNNRGLFTPAPVYEGSAIWVGAAAVAGLLAAILFAVYARQRRMRTGSAMPVAAIVAACIVAPPLLAYFAAGEPIGFVAPHLQGFNFIGGLRLFPEFVALLLGLSLYTASFIAEVVRAGIQAVPLGQSEAAAALGLTRSQSLKLVIRPQAMRVIVPPLTSQYLNLIKNSSLAVFIGYPDLVQVFAGTVLNQTGAAVQVVGITMAVYLTISLVISLAMNLYNRRMALRER